MQIRKYIPFLFILVLISISFASFGQCAMCKGTVQTSDYARSINKGIQYLLFTPYLLIAGVLFMWAKNRDKFNSKEY